MIKPVHGNIIEVFGEKFLSTDKNNWLEVHHKYYILTREKSWRLPWLYDESSLVTLCSWCHKQLHNEIGLVPVLQETGTGELKTVEDLTPCSRCGGLGWLPQYDYFEGGICFQCDGEKYLELIKAD